jgi:hypothetical protein
MSDLAGFGEDEIELVSGVLYKVGVWVSHADDVDGEEDDEREMKALGACMRAVAKKHDGPGLVDDVARVVLARTDRWEEWTDYSFNVLPDVARAVAVMKAHGTKDDVKNYKMALVEVGSTVAMAHGEFGQYDEDEEKSGFGALLGKITSGFGKDHKDHPMNVSAAEDGVLSELKAVLREA